DLQWTEARARRSLAPSRFMESPDSLLRTHWDHEPPLTRPSATLSPSDGERDGVRGRFMERTHRTLCAPCTFEPASGPLTPSEGERVAGRPGEGGSMGRALHGPNPSPKRKRLQ